MGRVLRSDGKVCVYFPVYLHRAGQWDLITSGRWDACYGQVERRSELSTCDRMPLGGLKSRWAQGLCVETVSGASTGSDSATVSSLSEECMETNWSTHVSFWAVEAGCQWTCHFLTNKAEQLSTEWCFSLSNDSHLPSCMHFLWTTFPAWPDHMQKLQDWSTQAVWSWCFMIRCCFKKPGIAGWSGLALVLYLGAAWLQKPRPKCCSYPYPSGLTRPNGALLILKDTSLIEKLVGQLKCWAVTDTVSRAQQSRSCRGKLWILLSEPGLCSGVPLIKEASPLEDFAVSLP